jgi:hypothetical protein
MNSEFIRMQKLAGIITENKSAKKDTKLTKLIKESLKRVLNENMFEEGDIVTYMGEKHKVLSDDGYVVKLTTMRGEEKKENTVMLNYNQVKEKVRTSKDYMNEADWFDYLPDHPANQSDDKIRKGYEPKTSPFNILANTGESAIFEKDGKLYYFYYGNMDRSDFEEYADRIIINVEPDGEGGYDEELDDEWEMNDDVVSNYLNDNYSRLSTGYGLDDYEEGKDFIEIDQSLKNEILDTFNDNKVKIALDKLK